MLKNRLLTEKLKKLSSAFPAVTLTGARQVGKTTLLHEMFGKAFDYVVFDPFVDIENARKDPDLFLSNHKTPLILDEIQYAPELVSALKRKIDQNRSPGQYFLTGSQQWSVIQSMSESLAGRTAFIHLNGFCIAEIEGLSRGYPWLESWLQDTNTFKATPKHTVDALTTFEQIWRGWLPEAQNIPEELVPEFYKAYHQTYIERDIRLLADISDWQLFGRFTRLSSSMTAQEINFSQLGRELGITPQTSKRWLELLRATFQLIEIPAFSMNTIKRISNKPKGYFADSGSICTLQAIQAPNVLGGHPMWGPIFETAVVLEIIKQSEALAAKPNFYHWRAHSGAEVDLILEWNGRYFPIEIKGKSHPTKADTHGITAFRKAYPKLDIAPGLVICNCAKPFPLTSHDWALPWNLALTAKTPA
ncbi:MAG: ATP-binding protein [Opitutales bacterium]|tara:strand:- start:333 stop:1586 length:1254 start_codon:yes stop_codon:yes gene_type:complete